jgi:hypothetical protein
MSNVRLNPLRPLISTSVNGRPNDRGLLDVGTVHDDKAKNVTFNTFSYQKARRKPNANRVLTTVTVHG